MSDAVDPRQAAAREEPHITYVTIRDSMDELHLECRFDDGQKFAAVKVAMDFDRLANQICDFLNATAADTAGALSKEATAEALKAGQDAVAAYMREPTFDSDHFDEVFLRAAFPILAAAHAQEVARLTKEIEDLLRHDVAITRASNALRQQLAEAQRTLRDVQAECRRHDVSPERLLAGVDGRVTGALAAGGGGAPDCICADPTGDGRGGNPQCPLHPNLA